jgi:outer membrane protein assembly factor BamD (BamD/ComL family)
MRQIKKLLPVSMLLALAFSACRTAPAVPDETASSAEIFQLAQTASVERSDNSAALFYYNLVLERFPEDTAGRVTAKYEIAFIHYKNKDYKNAKSGFEEVLQEYQNNPDADIPEWPGILSRKLLDKMENR